MRYKNQMSSLGYVVLLADGSDNPTAVEADKILRERRPSEGEWLGGVCVAKAWALARERLEGKNCGRPIVPLPPME